MHLAAALVLRGHEAPLSASVMLQQPERGSALHAGGTKPAGFWSGAVSTHSAVLFLCWVLMLFVCMVCVCRVCKPVAQICM
jgi:hypothetical protein